MNKSQTLTELRGWLLSAGEGWAGDHPRMRPRIHEWTTLYSSIREIFVDGLPQTQMELREWVMSAGDEWAGEGVAPLRPAIAGHLPPLGGRSIL